MNAETTAIRINSWANMITAQKESGLTVRQWCLENGISEKAYHYRQKKVREAVYKEMSGENGFAEVSTGPAVSSGATSVMHIGAVTIELSNEVSQDLLINIARMLKHAE